MKRKFTKYPSKITASTIPTSDIELLARKAADCNDELELLDIISGLELIDRKLYGKYMTMLRDDSLSIPYIASQLSDELMSYYVDDIDACNNVMASTHRYSAGRIEDDGTEDFYYDTGFDSYDEACDWGINHDCTHIYDREKDEFTPINSCDTKYFANMVNASSDTDDYKYYVAGYYDNLMRGLGDDLSTDSFDAVLDFANELANEGYFIKITNTQTGSEVHYDSNVWLDAIENGDVPEDVFEVTM